MSVSALTLVLDPSAPKAPRSSVSARKGGRGTVPGSAEAKASAEALQLAREQERQYVLAAQDGDMSAFAQLVRRHQQRAYAVAPAW